MRQLPVSVVVPALLRTLRGAALVFGALTLGAPAALAQAQPSASSRSFLLERFTPQAGDGDILGVQSPSISPQLLPRVMAWADHAAGAANQTTLTLAGSVGLFGRVELGLAVPVVITPGGEAFSALRVQAKVRLLDSGPFSFGASLPVTLTTGGSWGATPRLLAQWSGPRRSAVLLDLGLALRQPQPTVDNALSWSVAGKIDLLPSHDLSLMANLGGELSLTGARVVSPLEALVAIRWMPIAGLVLTLGAGPGLSQGDGTARFRVVASVGFAPPERDQPPHPAQPPAADEVFRQPLPPVL